MHDFYKVLNLYFSNQCETSQHFQLTLIFSTLILKCESINNIFPQAETLFIHIHLYRHLHFFNETRLLSTTMYEGLSIQMNRSFTRTRLWYHYWDINSEVNMREYFSLEYFFMRKTHCERHIKYSSKTLRW